MKRFCTSLAPVLALAAPVSAHNDSFRHEYTRDLYAVAALLESIRNGHAIQSEIKFEGLNEPEVKSASDFSKFSLECPLSRISTIVHSDIRQPIFVTWDCTDYTIDDRTQLSDLRHASVRFKSASIVRIKFGVAEVITINPK